MARVQVIGIEPGAAALPAEALAAVRSCEILSGAPRHLALVPDFPGEVWTFEPGVGRIVERIAAEPGRRVAVLATGDPGFFGIAAALLRRLDREEVCIRPAVSAMQAAFARAGEVWSDARFVSLHGRPLESLAEVLGVARVGLFTDAVNNPARVAEFLLEAGWGELEMVVAEDLGSASERLSRGRPAAFLEWRGSPVNVVLLLRDGPDPRLRGPGLPDHLFSSDGGLITKAEVRAVALGLLRVPRRGVLWDIGAGSGSIGVEACLLAPALEVWALEKVAARLGHIRENRARFRAAGLRVIAGAAPAALTALPDPDAVFVGGSGGRLAAVLAPCWERLRPGGSLVVAAVLIDSLCDVLAWARATGAVPELTEIRASRSRGVGARWRLEPTNPVTLARFEKPGKGDVP